MARVQGLSKITKKQHPLLVENDHNMHLLLLEVYGYCSRYLYKSTWKMITNLKCHHKTKDVTATASGCLSCGEVVAAVAASV